MPAVISHKAVEESCNYRKGLHKLCFRVEAVHSASQGSAEVAPSPKPWGLKLFQSDVRNEMHTCVHCRHTERPSCAVSPSVSSSVSQHSRPFTVHHTAAHDAHTHQPIKERGRAQNRHFVSRLWLHTKAIIDLFSLKNKSFFMKSRALSFCPWSISLQRENFLLHLEHQMLLLHWPFPAALSDLLTIKEDSWIKQFVVWFCEPLCAWTAGWGRAWLFSRHPRQWAVNVTALDVSRFWSISVWDVRSSH